MICRACGGGRAHHSVDGDPCWCPGCLQLPEAERCQVWDPVPPAARFKKTAKPSGVSRPQVSLPREGTLQRQVYDFLAAAGVAGLTTSELEYKTMKRRDDIRAAVAQLMGRELVENSGTKRAKDLVSREEVAWRIKNG